MWDREKFCQELAGIVNMDSGTAFQEGVSGVCLCLEEKLREAGLMTKTFDQNTRLEARSHDSEDFDVLMAGHMDTVFPQGTAAARPYSEDGNLAHGPGVADMKAGLIEVLHLVRRLRKEKPDLKLCVAFSGDEETGSENSKDWFMELGRHTRYAFVFEPGRPGNHFVRSRKGCVDLHIAFFGKSAHAGAAPEQGISACVEMARWITALTSLQNLPAGTSVNAGLVKGGTATNVVPDHAEAYFDIRFTDPKEYEKIMAETERLKENPAVPGVKVSVHSSGFTMPMNPSPVTEELIKRLERAAEGKGMEIGWVDTGGVSDANHIAGIGVPTLCGCGPCGANLHSEEEYLELDSIGPRMELMYSLLSCL